jgi:hypothetical protein
VLLQLQLASVAGRQLAPMGMKNALGKASRRLDQWP